ncbi:hypothetical protein [Halobaculum gomorrense]|uniref:Rod shape-determining protein MreD n=1 Tax=Halobaculum gomorrense TaxID=43928 RepID=A0A1M5MQC0_9EURY|nr:hypothetical protein [Halobaculum gomorrense]SHG79491.1 hypothetical protein SAMN05443636_1101 [Halobaculum gomorrense]
MSGASTRAETGFRSDFDFTTLITLAGMTAVIFLGGLFITEAVGEIPPDIDFKPFFIVYAIMFFVPWGTPTISVAVGGGLGEAIGDVIEGYEVDDPFGLAGYVVGFTVAGYLMKDAEGDDYVTLSIAAVVGALVQILIEGLGILVISGESLSVYATVVAGNTVTHGIVLGLIPLIPTVAALEGRVERFMGEAAKSTAD